MPTLRRFAALASCAALFACLGCGERLPARYPVEGEVRYQGKPLAEATVLFHPLGVPAPGLAQPMALTDEQGKFRLTTARSDDGATPGDYAVTVTLPALATVGEEPTRNGPNTLPALYARPETTPLRYVVVAGPNVVPLIELK
jgi:hypothetical protein